MKLPVQFVEFSAKGVVALQTEEITTDNLAPWEVVVQNETTLISAGTELSNLYGTEPRAKYPSRSGYAAIGRLVAKGEAVNDFSIGDRVFYAGNHASAQRFLHGQDHQWGQLYPVPEGITSEDAVFVCLVEIAMTAPNITMLDLGDTVAVFGLGLVGNLAAQLYQIQARACWRWTRWPAAASWRVRSGWRRRWTARRSRRWKLCSRRQAGLARQ